MATAAVSSSSIFQELQSFYQTRQSDLQQLAGALQSGKLNDAQTAFNALATLGQDGPFANSEPFANSTRAQDFEAVGQALQAGNLSQAQTAFATMQASFHHAQAASATIVNLSNTDQANASSTSNTSSILQQIQAYSQQRASDLAQLAQDLQAGNLTAAQQDYQTLTALGQTGPNANGQVYSQSNRNQDFQAIGQALQAGDLSGAQSALANLQSTLGKQSQQAQSAISAYNQSGVEIVINLISSPSNSASSSASASTTTGSTSESSTAGSDNSSTGPSATPPELIIDLESSGAQGIPEVTINFGNGTSSPQLSVGTEAPNGAVTNLLNINLNQQTNYDLVLNLLNSGAVNQAQSGTSALSVNA